MTIETGRQTRDQILVMVCFFYSECIKQDYNNKYYVTGGWSQANAGRICSIVGKAVRRFVLYRHAEWTSQFYPQNKWAST